MLARLGLSSAWQWAAYGKQQTAKDYFRLGSDSPILEAFSQWIDNGYKLVAPSEKNQPTEFHSWRFWAKSPDKDRLICGVIKDSADLIGRPYPFLVIGHGKVSKWEKYWEFLPLACEPIWLRAEQIHRQQFDSLKQMTDFLNEFSPPAPQWSEWQKSKPQPIEQAHISDDASSFRRKKDRMLEQLKNQSRLIIDLADAPTSAISHTDPFLQASEWHEILKAQIRTIPNVVFIGGVLSNPQMAVFLRPLAPDDFKSLWTINSEKEKSNGN